MAAEQTNVALASQEEHAATTIPNNQNCFEVAANRFLQEYEPNSPEMTERLEEISRLLSASSDNIDEVKNQKWFQRAWATVTRRNKRLAETNQRNLLTVQQGAFEFLDVMARQSPIVMEAVVQTLQRVEDNQIQNERLKAHLLMSIQKFRQRHSELQLRQEAVEDWAERHQHIDHSATHSQMRIYWVILAVVFAFSAALIPVVLPRSTTAWIASGGLGLAAFVSLLVWLFQHKPEPQQASLLPLIERGPNRIAEQQKLQLIKNNRRLLPALRQTIKDSMAERYSEVVIDSVLAPLNDCLATLDPAFEELPEESTPEEYAAFLKVLISVSPDVIGRFREESAAIAGQLMEDANDLLKAMAGSLMGQDALGAVIASESGQQHERLLSNDLCSAAVSIKQQLEEIEELRVELAQRFPRWEKVATENVVKAVGKAFLKGLLIIPDLLDDQEEFMTETHTVIDNLINSWCTLVETKDSNLEPLLRKTVENHLHDIIARWDSFWSSCDDAQISLEGADSKWRALLD